MDVAGRTALHVLQTLSPGGAQDLLVELAGAARPAGITLHVASLLPVDPSYPVVQELRLAGVPVHDLALRSPADVRGPRALARTVLAAHADVLHTHGRHADLLGAVVSRRLRVALVSTVHLIEDGDTWAGRGKRRLGGMARGSAARVVTVSDAQRAWYLRTFAADPARVVTVRNGVAAPAPTSAAAVLRVRAELGIGRGDVMTTSLGLLRHDRGHRTLLDAARELDPLVVLVIAGEGPQRTVLEAQAATVGLRVVFTGFRRDVDVLLAASDVVVQSSLTDALPTSLVRALAAARPIVASDVGGIPEIVHERAGLLVPPGDPTALAGALRTVTSDAGLRERMGEAGLGRFREEFEASRWAGRLRQLYDQVVLGAEEAA